MSNTGEPRKRVLRVIDREVGRNGRQYQLSVHFEAGLDLENLAKSGNAITPAEVIGWFRTAGSGMRLPEPSESTPGFVELVHTLNLIRVTEDAATATTGPGDPMAETEERLWRVKLASTTLRDDLPHLIETLMAVKGLRGEEAAVDDEVGDMIRLYEAAAPAKLPFVHARLRDLAGHTGRRRAPWHNVGALIAERAKHIWWELDKRRLGVGRVTSPLVVFVGLALPRVGPGEQTDAAIMKALTRPRTDNSISKLGDFRAPFTS